MFLLPTWTLRSICIGPGTAPRDSENARAVNAHVREFVQMGYANVEGLAAAHGKTSDGAARAVGINAIIFFHARHDVIQKILYKRIRGRPGSAPAKPECAGMAGRHDHNHWF